MAFLPAPQPTRPQNVALRVKETDFAVFPTVRDIDIRRQEQDRFSVLPSRLLHALDERSYQFIRTKTDTEKSGFTRCNGNLINPAPIEVKPWEPKRYLTKESWQRDTSVFDEQSRRKAVEAEHMARAKNYFDNFTEQPRDRSKKAMVLEPYHRPASEIKGDIQGFKGLGQFSDGPHGGRGHGQVNPSNMQKLPPWLQEGAAVFHKSPQRNPSMVSDNISMLFGNGGGPSQHGYASGELVTSSTFGESPSRSLGDKGASFAKEISHKKFFPQTSSTGPKPSPVGAHMLRREQTTNGEYYSPSRLDALSQGRAYTSMLP